MRNMKKGVSVVLLFYVLVALIFSIIPSCHCSRGLKNPIRINDDKLIDNICKHTPKYNLCLQYLRSDPGSSRADVAGLGLIMVKVMAAKATVTNKKIQQLLQRKSLGSPETKALKSCGEMYKTILEADIPEAKEALRKGDPKFADDAANDAANEATYCEEEFAAAKSPLTRYNNAMHDVAAITAAIVKMLL